jgi:hypothetical protein
MFGEKPTPTHDGARQSAELTDPPLTLQSLADDVDVLFDRVEFLKHATHGILLALAMHILAAMLIRKRRV